MKLEIENFIPILHAELEIIAQDESYVICNTFTKYYAKISKDVYNLIVLIDGKKNIIEIANEFNKKYNTEITNEFIYNLIFNKLEICQNAENIIKKRAIKPGYLKFSFIILNEKIIGKIVPFFYFLFNKKIVFCFLFFSLILMAFILFFKLHTLINIHYSIQNSVISFFILMAISVTFHEFGHITAASFYGAKHGGIGGGFYLFKPVYYADVTDIWRLTKMKRIIVNCAGVYFECILNICILIVGLFFNNHLLISISIIIIIYSIANFNPFLRSDGYWVLSDLLNTPNLMKHSYNKILNIFKFKLSNKKWGIGDFLLLFYGIISLFFTGYFFYYILIKNPNSLIYFPKNMYNFIINLFSSNISVSIFDFANLLIPLIFILLVYNWSKNIILLLFNKLKKWNL